jgi:chromosome segregation ATPase
MPDAEAATFEYPASDMYDSAQEGIDATPDRAAPLDHSGANLSPIKPASTPGFSTMSTPGVGREPPTHEDSCNSALHHEYPSTALQDVTGSHQDYAAVPFTPSPVGMNSKLSDMSTPRAPLDDAERRKSHVLAVLQSTGLPSRTRLAVRGTPHPLRRVSMPPSSDSITEEGTPLSRNTPTATPGSRTHLTVNSSHISGGNESFVSIASSADLTSDRRAATAHKRLSRGNTSFPTILLPTTGASPASGGSLRGLSEGRADGIKIHKHLNAMNKQLLDTNADLAREAEAWRDEVDRLRGILQDAGVEFEDVDVAANVSQGGRDGRSFSGLPSHLARRHSNGSDTVTSQLAQLNAPSGGLSHQGRGPSPDGAADNHDVTLQEMVDRLEELEAGLDEKDRIITSLEEKLSSRTADTSGDQAVAEQVGGLTRQLEEAERARVALHEEFALKTQQHAEKFGEICQGFEEQVKGLEGELAASRGEADRLRADKSRLEALASTGDLDAREIEWRKQVRDLEVAVGRAQEEVKDKIGEVESLKKRLSQVHDERRLQQRETVELQARVRSLETQLDEAITELEHAKAVLAETQGAQEAAENEVGQLDNDIAELQQAHADQQAELQRQQEEIQELVERLQQVESEDGHKTADEEMATELEQMRLELEEVATSMAEKDSEIEELRGKLEVAGLAASTGRTRASPVGDQRSGHVDVSAINDQASFIEAIQDRLDEAYREIGRLKHELAASPHRKSDIETKDAKIKALEREKATLSERLAATRAGTSSPQTTILQSAGSPFTRPTPSLHKAIASLKTPKTPGPLKEVS